MKIETTAHVKDGQLLVRNRNYIQRECLASGLTEFDVVITKKSKRRSYQQNRWYWLAVQMLSEHIGYSKEEIHEILKFKFLKENLVSEKTGEVYEYVKSTTDLTTTEFSVYMEEIIKWSAENFNLVLPYPNEQLSIL